MGFANITSGDVLSDVFGFNSHHWHSVEFLSARAGGTEILGVVVIVTSSVKKRVTRPERDSTGWTAWVGVGLRVSSEDNADGLWSSLLTWGTWGAVETIGTSETWEAFWAFWTFWTAFTGFTRWTWWTGDAWDTGWTLWTISTR